MINLLQHQNKFDKKSKHVILEIATDEKDEKATEKSVSLAPPRSMAGRKMAGGKVDEAE